MKVFVTGGGDYIGAILVKELTQHGHHVVALGRSEGSGEAIEQAEGEFQQGSVEDVDLLKKCAQASDGVIHLALSVDDLDIGKALAIDRAAIKALAEGLGSGKPLVLTSGALLLPKGQISTEHTPPERDNMFGERAVSEDLAKSLSNELGVRGCVVRLSPVVHCHEDKFFVPWLIDSAKKEKYIAFNGDNTRWPAVHRSDAVTLFRLALEKGVAGSIYHGIAEQGVPVKVIVETIGKHLDVPVKSMSFEEAQEVIPFMAIVQTRDCAASSDWTQQELGWKPTGPDLIADMEANYFS